MFISNKTKPGFTLIETLVALAVGLVTSFLIVMTVTHGLATIRNSKAAERVHAEAIYVVDTLTYWVKQGQNLNSPDSETLEITLPDATIKTITKTGSTLTIDGIPITNPELEIQSLEFAKLAKSVRISFNITSPNLNRSFAGTTTIAQRN